MNENKCHDLDTKKKRISQTIGQSFCLERLADSSVGWRKTSCVEKE